MEIIIAQSVNDLTPKKHLSKTTDILVFEQSIMILLDKKGFYKVIEDFYSEDQFYVMLVYTEKSRIFLSQLIKI